MPALRITGGVLVFLIGFNMLHGAQSKTHNPEKEDIRKSKEAKLSVAISPLALPILAGPGTIATAMNFCANSDIRKVILTIAIFALLCIITFLFFIFGQKIVKYIGESGIKVVSRLMGFILAVIGCQMLLQGIFGAIKYFK